jgi:NitT/TauT family transport system permease protein
MDMALAGWIRLIVVVGAIAIIEGLCRTGIIAHTVMIPPSQMASGLLHILATGEYTVDILSSLGSVVLATIIAVILGFLAGLLIHALPAVREVIEPLLVSYYAIPTFMFYPVFIILFGVGRKPIIAIAVLLAIVAMITATLNGLDRIPAVLRRTATLYRMSRIKTALLIDLPAAAPYLFTGMKLCVAYAFIGVIASEFILSGSGLGYAIGYAYNNFQNQNMYALMLLIIILVTAINAVLDVIDKRLQTRRRR